MRRSPARLSPMHKVALAIRVWSAFALVVVQLRRRGLEETVRHLGAFEAGRRRPQHPPARLSRAVSRSLRIGRWQPRCLIQSLVLYRLVCEQGEPVQVVIGLPESAEETDAHAWVELRGRDIGPAPGRFGHRELVRYPSAARPDSVRESQNIPSR